MSNPNAVLTAVGPAAGVPALPTMPILQEDEGGLYILAPPLATVPNKAAVVLSSRSNHGALLIPSAASLATIGANSAFTSVSRSKSPSLANSASSDSNGGLVTAGASLASELMASAADNGEHGGAAAGANSHRESGSGNHTSSGRRSPNGSRDNGSSSSASSSAAAREAAATAVNGGFITLTSRPTTAAGLAAQLAGPRPNTSGVIHRALLASPYTHKPVGKKKEGENGQSQPPSQLPSRSGTRSLSRSRAGGTRSGSRNGLLAGGVGSMVGNWGSYISQDDGVTAMAANHLENGGDSGGSVLALASMASGSVSGAGAANSVGGGGGGFIFLDSSQASTAGLIDGHNTITTVSKEGKSGDDGDEEDEGGEKDELMESLKRPITAPSVPDPALQAMLQDYTDAFNRVLSRHSRKNTAAAGGGGGAAAAGASPNGGNAGMISPNLVDGSIMELTAGESLSLMSPSAVVNGNGSPAQSNFASPAGGATSSSALPPGFQMRAATTDGTSTRRLAGLTGLGSPGDSPLKTSELSGGVTNGGRLNTAPSGPAGVAGITMTTVGGGGGGGGAYHQMEMSVVAADGSLVSMGSPGFSPPPQHRNHNNGGLTSPFSPDVGNASIVAVQPTVGSPGGVVNSAAAGSRPGSVHGAGPAGARRSGAPSPMPFLAGGGNLAADASVVANPSDSPDKQKAQMQRRGTRGNSALPPSDKDGVKSGGPSPVSSPSSVVAAEGSIRAIDKNSKIAASAVAAYGFKNTRGGGKQTMRRANSALAAHSPRATGASAAGSGAGMHNASSAFGSSYDDSMIGISGPVNFIGLPGDGSMAMGSMATTAAMTMMGMMGSQAVVGGGAESLLTGGSSTGTMATNAATRPARRWSDFAASPPMDGGGSGGPDGHANWWPASAGMAGPALAAAAAAAAGGQAQGGQPQGLHPYEQPVSASKGGRSRDPNLQRFGNQGRAGSAGMARVGSAMGGPRAMSRERERAGSGTAGSVGLGPAGIVAIANRDRSPSPTHQQGISPGGSPNAHGAGETGGGFLSAEQQMFLQQHAANLLHHQLQLQQSQQQQLKLHEQQMQAFALQHQQYLQALYPQGEGPAGPGDGTGEGGTHHQGSSSPGGPVLPLPDYGSYAAAIAKQQQQQQAGGQLGPGESIVHQGSSVFSNGFNNSSIADIGPQGSQLAGPQASVSILSLNGDEHANNSLINNNVAAIAPGGGSVAVVELEDGSSLLGDGSASMVLFQTETQVFSPENSPVKKMRPLEGEGKEGDKGDGKATGVAKKMVVPAAGDTLLLSPGGSSGAGSNTGGESLVELDTLLSPEASLAVPTGNKALASAAAPPAKAPVGATTSVAEPSIIEDELSPSLMVLSPGAAAGESLTSPPPAGSNPSGGAASGLKRPGRAGTNNNNNNLASPVPGFTAKRSSGSDEGKEGDDGAASIVEAGNTLATTGGSKNPLSPAGINMISMIEKGEVIGGGDSFELVPLSPEGTLEVPAAATAANLVSSAEKKGNSGGNAKPLPGSTIEEGDSAAGPDGFILQGSVSLSLSGEGSMIPLSPGYGNDEATAKKNAAADEEAAAAAAGIVEGYGDGEEGASPDRPLTRDGGRGFSAGFSRRGARQQTLAVASPTGGITSPLGLTSPTGGNVVVPGASVSVLMQDGSMSFEDVSIAMLNKDVLSPPPATAPADMQSPSNNNHPQGDARGGMPLRRREQEDELLPPILPPPGSRPPSQQQQQNLHHDAGFAPASRPGTSGGGSRPGTRGDRPPSAPMAGGGGGAFAGAAPLMVPLDTNAVHNPLLPAGIIPPGTPTGGGRSAVQALRRNSGSNQGSNANSQTPSRRGSASASATAASNVQHAAAALISAYTSLPFAVGADFSMGSVTYGSYYQGGGPTTTILTGNHPPRRGSMGSVGKETGPNNNTGSRPNSVMANSRPGSQGMHMSRPGSQGQGQGQGQGQQRPGSALGSDPFPPGAQPQHHLLQPLPVVPYDSSASIEDGSMVAPPSRGGNVNSRGGSQGRPPIRASVLSSSSMQSLPDHLLASSDGGGSLGSLELSVQQQGSQPPSRQGRPGTNSNARNNLNSGNGKRGSSIEQRQNQEQAQGQEKQQAASDGDKGKKDGAGGKAQGAAVAAALAKNPLASPPSKRHSHHGPGKLPVGAGRNAAAAVAAAVAGSGPTAADLTAVKTGAAPPPPAENVNLEDLAFMVSLPSSSGAGSAQRRPSGGNKSRGASANATKKGVAGGGGDNNNIIPLAEEPSWAQSSGFSDASGKQEGSIVLPGRGGDDASRARTAPAGKASLSAGLDEKLSVHKLEGGASIASDASGANGSIVLQSSSVMSLTAPGASASLISQITLDITSKLQARIRDAFARVEDSVKQAYTPLMTSPAGSQPSSPALQGAYGASASQIVGADGSLVSTLTAGSSGFQAPNVSPAGSPNLLGVTSPDPAAWLANNRAEYQQRAATAGAVLLRLNAAADGGDGSGPAQGAAMLPTRGAEIVGLEPMVAGGGDSHAASAPPVASPAGFAPGDKSGKGLRANTAGKAQEPSAATAGGKAAAGAGGVRTQSAAGAKQGGAQQQQQQQQPQQQQRGRSRTPTNAASANRSNNARGGRAAAANAAAAANNNARAQHQQQQQQQQQQQYQLYPQHAPQPEPSQLDGFGSYPSPTRQPRPELGGAGSPASGGLFSSITAPLGSVLSLGSASLLSPSQIAESNATNDAAVADADLAAAAAGALANARLAMPGDQRQEAAAIAAASASAGNSPNKSPRSWHGSPVIGGTPEGSNPNSRNPSRANTPGMFATRLTATTNTTTARSHEITEADAGAAAGAGAGAGSSDVYLRISGRRSPSSASSSSAIEGKEDYGYGGSAFEGKEDDQYRQQLQAQNRRATTTGDETFIYDDDGVSRPATADSRHIGGGARLSWEVSAAAAAAAFAQQQLQQQMQAAPQQVQRRPSSRSRSPGASSSRMPTVAEDRPLDDSVPLPDIPVRASLSRGSSSSSSASFGMGAPDEFGGAADDGGAGMMTMAPMLTVTQGGEGGGADYWPASAGMAGGQEQHQQEGGGQYDRPLSRASADDARGSRSPGSRRPQSASPSPKRRTVSASASTATASARRSGSPSSPGSAGGGGTRPSSRSEILTAIGGPAMGGALALQSQHEEEEEEGEALYQQHQHLQQHQQYPPAQPSMMFVSPLPSATMAPPPLGSPTLMTMDSSRSPSSPSHQQQPGAGGTMTSSRSVANRPGTGSSPQKPSISVMQLAVAGEEMGLGSAAASLLLSSTSPPPSAPGSMEIPSYGAPPGSPGGSPRQPAVSSPVAQRHSRIHRILQVTKAEKERRESSSSSSSSSAAGDGGSYSPSGSPRGLEEGSSFVEGQYHQE